MRPRVRLHIASAVATLAVAAIAGAAVPGVPSLYVEYAFDCTFTLTVDPGTVVTAPAAPGPTLPPGTYQLLTSMPNPSAGYPCPRPSFTLSGPGVSVSIVFAGQELHDERVLTLQPSSTYVAQDDNAPATSRKFFSTSATGSSTSLLTPSTATRTGAAKASEQPDIVGSAIVPYRGTLVATVTAAGKAALKLHGRSAGSLKPGRYDVAVVDDDAGAGFFVRHGTRKPVAVTGLAFVGKRTRRITLTAGRWTYYARPGKPTAFTVG